MKDNEAREALFSYVDGLLVGGIVKEIMERSDAYALAVHVDACEEYAGSASYKSESYQECGDDWYCDKAKELEELGR